MKLHLGLFLLLLSLVVGHEKYVQQKTEIKHRHEHWAIKLAEGVQAAELAKKFGFQHVKQHSHHRNIHLVKKLEGSKNFEELKRHNDVLWMEKQELRWHTTRFDIDSIEDPLFETQWHLSSENYGVNAIEVWDMGFTGKNITIAIVDDGLQSSHPDFRGNYFAEASFDFNDEDPNPEPLPSQSHGTQAAGVAAAAANSHCGVGIAPEAQLAGIRLIGGPVDDFTESHALAFRSDLIDIYSCSWGPQDDGKRLEGPGSLTQMTLRHGVENGRNGKGSIFVWAGGNGRRSSDNCNYDGYSSSRFTIAIGAVAPNGVQAWYSEECAMLVAVTASSGDKSNQDILTTDLKGSDGASPLDCSSHFGGTSAACPMAAGIIALALQYRPDLTWRDVQGVLINSAIQVDTKDPDWKINGAKLHVNHKYGFGRLDAQMVLKTAHNWKLLPQYINASCQNTEGLLLSATPTKLSCVISVPGMVVEHIELQTNITASYRGKISLTLDSPSGTKSVLSAFRSDYNADVPVSWKWGTIHTWGEKASGTWVATVSTHGVIPGDRFNSMFLTVFGHQLAQSD